MQNLYKKVNSEFLSIDKSLFGSKFSIYYKITTKDEDQFISEIFYYSVNENGLVNAYLNLMLDRGLDVLDRITVKELDYFLREDPKKSYFDKISKELLELISVGELIKKQHKKVVENESKIYSEQLHGPLNLMSTGELLELVEEILSHKSLSPYQLLCTDVDETTILLKFNQNLSSSDLEYISEQFRLLGHQDLRIKYES